MVFGASLGVVIAACSLSACSLWPSEPPSTPDPFGIVRIEPKDPNEPEDDDAPPFDSKTALAIRFPGLQRIDFMRVLIVPGPRSGSCWTRVSPLWETEADLEYSIDGEKEEASGIADLKAKGWWPTYGAPYGHGFERRAAFDSIDLKLGTTVTCGCADRPGTVDEESRSMELRFRWGKGKMPEIGAVVIEDGKRRSLRPSSIYGHFLTYEFATEMPYPGRSTASCEAHTVVSILGDPPIL